MTDQETGNLYPGPDPTLMGPTIPGTAASELGEISTGTAGSLKEKATQLREKAVSAIDEKREQSARVLDSAAAGLHKGAERLPPGGQSSTMAHSAAHKLEGAATYLRDHPVRNVLNDARWFVRGHPSQSLIAAVALGFLVGRALRKG